MMISRTIGALLGMSILAMTATVASAADIVVGGKNFTEQQILAEMTAHLLRAKDFDVDKRAGMGSAVLRQAQENGQIDVYWEYTGTSLIVYNKIEEQLSPEETYQKVKELDAEKGLVWLNPSEANNTYALVMRKPDAKDMNIHSLSDLAKAYNEEKELKLAANAEWAARPDGLKGLQETYGFKVPRANLMRMDTGLMYDALRQGRVDVSLAFATDGRIAAFDFEVLEDDKGFFPAYAITPVVRKEVLDKHPELADILNEVSAKLDDETMAQLNAQVDVERKTVEEVAEDFLQKQELI
jgi:osmoprotectant transport system substrate-binding protein